MSKQRCGWVSEDPLYKAYHDEEWGVPVYDDNIFFEFLVLESFQAGLSWITILKKRENFRKAFEDFNYKKIARFSEERIQILLNDKGIIRNKLKILAAVNNAQRFIEIQNEFGSFSEYIWKFVNHQPIQNKVVNYQNQASTSAISDKISKDLKQRGFNFLGSTTVYAFLQATGLINDHEEKCFRNKQLNKHQKN